mmetsp:Transcript_27790/g.74850  ORF Transcript_27790/g.74850 Transcript_27790/m.74850 type:complete len:309 (+) Transcript_27790:1024-1950(+)
MRSRSPRTPARSTPSPPTWTGCPWASARASRRPPRPRGAPQLSRPSAWTRARSICMGQRGQPRSTTSWRALRPPCPAETWRDWSRRRPCLRTSTSPRARRFTARCSASVAQVSSSSPQTCSTRPTCSCQAPQANPREPQACLNRPRRKRPRRSALPCPRPSPRATPFSSAGQAQALSSGAWHSGARRSGRNRDPGVVTPTSTLQNRVACGRRGRARRPTADRVSSRASCMTSHSGSPPARCFARPHLTGQLGRPHPAAVRGDSQTSVVWRAQPAGKPGAGAESYALQRPARSALGGFLPGSEGSSLFN